jgi:hypothetical protein
VRKRCVAALIAHLAEIAERKAHLELGYKDLFDYGVRRLGLSEGSVYLRLQVAGASRRVPELLQALAENRLSLSTAGLLAPYISEANAARLLRDCERRSRREVERYVAAFKSRPAFEPSIRKRSPTSGAGERAKAGSHESPEDRTGDGVTRAGGPSDPPAPAREMPPAPQAPAPGPSVVQPAAPDLFNVRFSASGEFRAKLLRLAEVLGIERPERHLAEVFERALDLALDQKDPERKSARRARREAARAGASPRSSEAESAGASASERTEVEPAPCAAETADRHPPTPATSTRSRYLSAPLRERVLARAGYRCEHRGPDGRRCPQRTGLQIDHRRALARGGSHEESNLRALCSAHNLFWAEKEFGREFIASKVAGRRLGAPPG